MVFPYVEGIYIMKGHLSAALNDMVQGFTAMHGYGSSYKKAYESIMRQLVDYENMRDVASLAGWIEMRQHAN